MQRTFAVYFAAFLLITAGCTRHPTDPQGRVTEAYVPVPGSVGFDIEPLKSGDGSLQFAATYTSQGKTARFRIEYGLGKTVQAENFKDFPMKMGQGRIVAEPGSDASVLLADLKKALEAKALPAKVQRLRTLSFTFVDIGNNLSQASGGGFNTSPPGNWTAMKIFVGEGEQEGQVFLNLNQTIRKGQFSIKDPEYGDLVLSRLAKVL